MQQRQQADEALVGMGVGVGGPAAEQPALFGEAEDRRTRSSVAVGETPMVGSTNTTRLALAQRKKSPVYRPTGPAEGPYGPGTPRCRPSSVLAQSLLARSSIMRRARSRTMARSSTMVRSLRGRVPARRARC